MAAYIPAVKATRTLEAHLQLYTSHSDWPVRLVRLQFQPRAQPIGPSRQHRASHHIPPGRLTEETSGDGQAALQYHWLRFRCW